MEAQLLLMQRLSSQLQAPSGQQAGSNGSNQDQWEDILQLWQEVLHRLNPFSMYGMFMGREGIVG